MNVKHLPKGLAYGGLSAVIIHAHVYPVASQKEFLLCFGGMILKLSLHFLEKEAIQSYDFE